MTDYNTMTDEELINAKETLQTSQIQNTAERDALNDNGTEIQKEIDAITEIQEARKQVEEMTDAEREAMQNALTNG